MSKTQELQFTGNWFIDAGILGFVNLMEEVYGWDLDTLEKNIADDAEKVYYGYFPFAYLYKGLLDNKKNQIGDREKELVKKLEKEFNCQTLEFNDNKELFEFVWDNFILNLFKTNEESKLHKLPISSPFYTNFLFFNPSKYNSVQKQKESFYNAIAFNIKEEDVLQRIDKTINKLLPSEDEFSNINYTRFSSRILEQIKYLFVYLLCFIYAFIRDSRLGNILFYSNNLRFSFKVNKKLKRYIEKYRNEKQDTNTLLKMTWNSIVDTLVEYKSAWSLENMYIISYEQLDNRKQEGIEYIGIPKLQASILLDDRIRNNLNTYIQFRSKKFNGNKSCWLIEEFINGKPLYPVILNHVNLIINGDIKQSLQFYPSLSALLIDAKISEFRRKRENTSLFTQDFFDNYKHIVDKIKDEKRTINYASFVYQITNKIARELLDAIKARDKNEFLYILLKNLNRLNGLAKNNNLQWFILNKILKNDVSFEMYGLVLILYLLNRR